ncbi:DUF4266 domain-containing protein [Sphaerotilus microaerophilus]|uniref:DUF4266 domain-containing protein n=1 Tax=Sphaerotilus microaerophilus TaxID=2914710 RepID=A0ABM7YLF5_9BURK|nr:DUF4266 domain-containing protein [Sphaerotilus sp. FB-5]BDI05275.1 hypothetical protein CATMQ487_22450 [Sphaerotilus sp. FB-5]
MSTLVLTPMRPSLPVLCRRRRVPSIRLGLGLMALPALLALGGCGTLGVQPWERDLLAKPSMQLTVSPLEAAADDHTYFSKEAATGGRSFGGGGCGCN